MPFIAKDRREIIGLYGLSALLEIKPGDRCFVHYKPMVDAWKAKPCWTTAHNIYKGVMYSLIEDEDEYAALMLAWQVFFALYVMPYELEKQKENGDV